MQKIIPPRLVQPYLGGQRGVLAGYVYRVQDTALQRPADLFAALDLGYEGSEFTPDVTEIYVIRWMARDFDQYAVPRSPDNGGDWRDKPPFTGTGVTSWREHVIPEFFTDPIPIPVGAEMYRLTDVREEFIAVYDGRAWMRPPPQEG